MEPDGDVEGHLGEGGGKGIVSALQSLLLPQAPDRGRTDAVEFHHATVDVPSESVAGPCNSHVDDEALDASEFGGLLDKRVD